MPRIIDRSNHKAAGLAQAFAPFTQETVDTQHLIARFKREDQIQAQQLAQAQSAASDLSSLRQAQTAEVQSRTDRNQVLGDLSSALEVPVDEEVVAFIAETRGPEAARAFELLPRGPGQDGLAHRRVLGEVQQELGRLREIEARDDFLSRMNGAVDRPSEPGLYRPEEVGELQRRLEQGSVTVLELERDFNLRLDKDTQRRASEESGRYTVQAMREALADPKVLARLDSVQGMPKAQRILAQYEAQLRNRPLQVDHGRFRADFELATSSPDLQDRVGKAEAEAAAAKEALAEITGLSVEELGGLRSQVGSGDQANEILRGGVAAPGTAPDLKGAAAEAKRTGTFAGGIEAKEPKASVIDLSALNSVEGYGKDPVAPEKLYKEDPAELRERMGAVAVGLQRVLESMGGAGSLNRKQEADVIETVARQFGLRGKAGEIMSWQGRVQREKNKADQAGSGTEMGDSIHWGAL